MESLESLKNQKRNLENELASITLKKSASTPWNIGVQDQYKSESYNFEEYTDYKKAYELKDKIANLDYQINTYEREVQERLNDAQKSRYNYESIEGENNNNPAIAARYNAQNRLFGITKLQQTIAKVSGQKRKFDKLWYKAISLNKKEQ